MRTEYRFRPFSRRRIALASLAVATALLLAGCASTRPVGSQVSDSWIATKVESKLAANPSINNFEIDVDVQDGVVRLSGNVETPDDRREAEDIARRTEGVRSVVNDIGIGDPTFAENVTDAWIATKVKTKLAADPEISPFNIDVDVVEGVVTLSGIVAKDTARSEAEHLAANTEGVKDVDNRIEVRTESS